MPTVTLNRKVLDKLIGEKLSDEKLKERISMLGTDLESLDKDEVVVEIFPKRPDLLSEQGLGRALSSFLGIHTGFKEYKINKSNYKLTVDSSVNKVRPFTACAVVKYLEFDDEKIKEVMQIQEKLHITYGRNRKKCAIGIYPLEKIQFPIKYLAKKPKEIRFIPLECTKEMNALEILENHPKGKGYAHLLKGKSVYPIFVDSNNKILSMPPIINSNDIGKISTQTKDIFIECSGFDLNTLETCLNMIVTALSDMGGKVYEIEMSYGKKKITTPNLAPKEMNIDLDYINTRLGLQLRETEIKNLLKKMGHDYRGGKVFTPAYRADILHQIDLAEDIAIAYGYENFKEEIPKVATIAQESNFEIFRNKICEILIGFGLIECNTSNIVSGEHQTKLMNTKLNCVNLANALNQEYNVLRAWNVPSLMKILKDNKHREHPQKIFTTGTIFKESNTETGIKESVRLAIALTDTTITFTNIKQILDGLFQAIDKEYAIKPVRHSSFIDGRVGRVSFKSKDLAYIGEIHPQVLENWELSTPVVVLELNLTDLWERL